MAELLKGAFVAAVITEGLIPRVEALAARGVTPTLAIVRVGEREDDLSYERGAKKRCATVGIDVREFVLASDCSQHELMDVIDMTMPPPLWDDVDVDTLTTALYGAIRDLGARVAVTPSRSRRRAGDDALVVVDHLLDGLAVDRHPRQETA